MANITIGNLNTPTNNSSSPSSSSSNGNNNNNNIMRPIRAAEKNRIATNDFANDIANISIQKYNNIVHNNNNNSNELNFQQTVLSTFVLRYKNPTNNQYTLKVVALGVGTKFLSKSNIENDIDGKCVKDLHAEILAQRSFKLFLYLSLIHI